MSDLDPRTLTETGPGLRWSITVADRVAEGTVSAPPPVGGAAGQTLDGYVEVDYAAMDRWFEEDDPIYAHPRDPYRVDVRSSSRHVLVRRDGEVVADSHRPKLLFETINPTRYWHLTTQRGRVEDAAWSRVIGELATGMSVPRGRVSRVGHVAAWLHHGRQVVLRLGFGPGLGLGIALGGLVGRGT